MMFVYIFLFKQKTAYEMRISDWSSDVCSSDLNCRIDRFTVDVGAVEASDVDDVEICIFLTELGVTTADGHVVQEDVAVRVPTCRRRRLIEQEAGSCIRSPLDHQKCGSGDRTSTRLNSSH